MTTANTEPRNFDGAIFTIDALDTATIDAARLTTASRAHDVADARMLLKALGIGSELRVVVGS